MIFWFVCCIYDKRHLWHGVHQTLIKTEYFSSGIEVVKKHRIYFGRRKRVWKLKVWEAQNSARARNWTISDFVCFFLSSNFCLFFWRITRRLGNPICKYNRHLSLGSRVFAAGYIYRQTSETFNTEKRNSERFICCAASMI